jgi:hypothetical protein
MQGSGRKPVPRDYLRDLQIDSVSDVQPSSFHDSEPPRSSGSSETSGQPTEGEKTHDEKGWKGWPVGPRSLKRPIHSLATGLSWDIFITLLPVFFLGTVKASFTRAARHADQKCSSTRYHSSDFGWETCVRVGKQHRKSYTTWSFRVPSCVRRARWTFHEEHRAVVC